MKKDIERNRDKGNGKGKEGKGEEKGWTAEKRC